MTLFGMRLFEPGKIIGRADDQQPLMTRWILFRVPWFGIYVHKFHRSDAEFALHDHPWSFLTLILWGGYVEEFGTGQSPVGHTYVPATAAEIQGPCSHRAGRCMHRATRRGWPHGAELDCLLEEKYHEPIYHRARRRPGKVLWRPATWRHRVIIEDETRPSWSLVFVGPRVRKWGFWLRTGWCWWRRTNYRAAICEDEVLHHGGGD